MPNQFLTLRALLLPTLLLLAIQSPAHAQAQTNLVTDGGFEQGGAGWAFSVNVANATGQVVTGGAHDGTNSYRLSNQSGFAPNVFGRLTQIVRGLQPYTTYRISCFARGTNAGIVWLGGGPGWYLRARFPEGTFGWTNIATEYTTGEDPPDFELMVLMESQTAAVWVDDVRMEAVRTDTAKRDAVLNRTQALWQTAADRLAALRARADTNANARADSVTQLGFTIADRYLQRTANGGSQAPQGGSWTRLQLEEVQTVLDETERRINAMAATTTPPPRQPWPAMRPPQVRDGLFYARMKTGPDEPFWFYGYGHFSQVIKDLPNFPALGASLIQDGTVGPSSMNADGTLGPGAQQLFRDLRTAQRDGMRMDWLLSPHYFPDWAFAKAPDARGGGPGFIAYDIDHPVVRDVLEKFTDEMCQKLKGNPALFSICLANEPVYDQSGRTKWSRPEYDDYLEKLHGTIDRLNELYGTHYTNFADIAPPAIGLKATDHENRAYYDWVRFNQQHFAAWHAWLNSLVKRRLPGIPTHAKFMVFYCLDRERLHFGADPEMDCAATDLAGCDAYAFPAADNQTYDWLGQEFYYDLMYSFRHQPVFNSENHLIPDGSPPNHIPGAATRAATWQGGLHHQGASTTWVWEEAADMSLSGSIYFRPANVYGAGRAMLDLNRFAAEAAALNQLPPRVALLYSPASIFWEGNYKHTILSCYRQLNYLGEPVDFITERQLAAGRNPGNEWIIAPAATHIPDTAAQALRRFVDAGGHLVLAGTNNFAYDEYHRPRPPAEIPPGLQLPATKTEHESAAALRTLLTANGVNLLPVTDAATGDPVWGVEFRRATIGDRKVVALINMTGKSLAAKIPAVSGRPLVDLLSAEPMDAENIQLAPMTPRLLETP